MSLTGPVLLRVRGTDAVRADRVATARFRAARRRTVDYVSDAQPTTAGPDARFRPPTIDPRASAHPVLDRRGATLSSARARAEMNPDQLHGDDVHAMLVRRARAAGVTSDEGVNVHFAHTRSRILSVLPSDPDSVRRAQESLRRRADAIWRAHEGHGLAADDDLELVGHVAGEYQTAPPTNSRNDTRDAIFAALNPDASDLRHRPSVAPRNTRGVRARASSALMTAASGR